MESQLGDRDFDTKRMRLENDIGSLETDEPIHSDGSEEPINHDEFDEKDLPLLANVDEIRVMHYLIKLAFDFESKSIKGIVVLFLDPVNFKFKKVRRIVLDSCSIVFQKVYLLKTQTEFPANIFKNYGSQTGTGKRNFYKAHNIDWVTTKGSELRFLTQKWSLTITDLEDHPALKDSDPSVIRIHYEVQPDTLSLHWRPTKGWIYQDGQPQCVYTPACPVNNRGIFPCQEPPSAMASWECFTVTGKKYKSLLTSEEPGEIIQEENDQIITYFYSSMVLPMSTFALVVGQFYFERNWSVGTNCTLNLLDSSANLANATIPISCKHDDYPCRIKSLNTSQGEFIAIRTFCLVDDFKLGFEDLETFISSAVKSTYKILGTLPFSRIDFVILPKYFNHLGLCSPNLIFLAPSIFYGESPLYHYRLPHEITHYWFGLLVGAKDWLDEYLSEGFATFMEDVLYVDIFKEKFDAVKIQEEIDVKACMRLVTLQSELINLDSSFKILSPEKECQSKLLRNGLEPVRPYTQVHYLKGYFLLRQLMHFVGQDRFLTFLRNYVWEFHGQLVTSDQFLDFYYESFRDILHSHPKFLSIEDLKIAWLKSDALPEPLKSCNILTFDFPNEFFELFPNCKTPLEEVRETFKALCSTKKISNWNVWRRKLEELSTHQFMIFLEKVISHCGEVPTKHSKTVWQRLARTGIFDRENHNPEVTHRICELILIHKDVTRLPTVVSFLENHQALGVYLYGELMITETKKFQNVASAL